MAGTPILIGTASWTDKPLVGSGRFYPPEARDAESRLRFYATQFPIVEVDSTYYALPRDRNADLWVERTPRGFMFDVKAFGLFTEHPVAVARLPGDVRAMLPPALAAKRNLYRKDAPSEVVDACWATYNDALQPLDDAGKLGVLVFQFPKWVFPNRETWAYFEEIRHRLGRRKAAVEFRNDVWMRADNREETLARLGELGFTYICVDEPQGFTSSVPPVAAATTDIGFVRFHGRNAEKWESRTRTSMERFDYWYEVEELQEWLPGFARLAQDTKVAHAIINTNNLDQGPANARLLGEQLRKAGLNVADPRPG